MFFRSAPKTDDRTTARCLSGQILAVKNSKFKAETLRSANAAEFRVPSSGTNCLSTLSEFPNGTIANRVNTYRKPVDYRRPIGRVLSALRRASVTTTLTPFPRYSTAGPLHTVVGEKKNNQKKIGHDPDNQPGSTQNRRA